MCYFETGKSDLNKLKEIAASLAKTSILIITVSVENFDFKKIRRFKLWLNEFSRVARVFDCSFSSNKALFDFFSSWVSDRGSEICQANFSFLLSRVSRNWQLVFNELDKLCAYAYGREILKDDILNLVVANLDFNAFELADAILSFEFKRALKIFRNLVELNVGLFLVLGAVNSCFIDLFRVCVCSRYGLADSQISEIFNYRGCEFKIRNARKFMGRFKLNDIRKCIGVLAKLDLDLKASGIDKEVLVEKAIVEMTSRR